MAFMAKRRRFRSQFWAEAVQMVIQTGHPVTQVARESQINSGKTQAWNDHRFEAKAA